MKARSGQNHDNKIAPQVNFNPTAANIMDMLCIFVITKQYFFQRVSSYFQQQELSIFCFNYMNTLFIHVMNYFSVVPRIIFLMCIKNYFLIGPRIILHSIANLFFGLQCIAGLAWTGSTFDHFENFGKWRSTFKENAKAKHCQRKKQKRFSSSLQNLSGASSLSLMMWFSGLKI